MTNGKTDETVQKANPAPRRRPKYLLWSVVIVVVGAISWVSYEANTDFLAVEHTDGALEVIGGAEVGLTEYYEDRHGWPAQLADVYSAASDKPPGKYVSEIKMVNCAAEHCGVLGTLAATAQSKVAGRTIEVWTLDGGKTWKCGPGNANPVEPVHLTGSCRDENPL